MEKEGELSRLRATLNDRTEYIVLLEQQMAQGKVQSGESSQQLYYLEQ